MTDFYHATSSQQSALMVFVFLGLVLCLFNFFMLYYRQKSNRLRFMNAGVFIVLFTLDAFMGHAFRQMQEGTPYRELLRLPMGSLWCIATLAFMLLAVEDMMMIRLSKQNLHRDSVKQAFDILPSAICYFTSEGVVKLCNLQMDRLFRSLAQSDLQNLEELHHSLDACDRQSGVIRYSEETQTYLFPDGKAWHYSETKVTAADGAAYTESIFTDVTKLHEYSIKLEEQTKRLEQLSCELKQLSDNARSVAGEQEVLSAKTMLHDRMGAGVLAIRRILRSRKSEEAAYALELFQKAVRIIENDSESRFDRGKLTEFLHDAEAIGVRVILSGEMPEQEEISYAFILAMRECLTNGVRHADASEMRVAISQKMGAATLQIANNGTAPKGTIVPKGGLKNLDRYIVDLNGTMEILSQPVFELRVTIPIAKEGV